jgi:hypothetical protein
MLKHLIGWRGYALAVALAYLAGCGTTWKVRDWMAAEAALKAAHSQTKAVVKVVARVEKQGAVTQEISLKAAETKTRIQTVTRILVQEVPVYVSSAADDRCVVPTGFVRIHDAAAAGSAVSDPAGQPNDTPSGVDLSAVAATVTNNYGAAHENAAQLTALQDWVRGQQALAATGDR